MYKCGQIWVSDHAQIDVAVLDENGKPNVVTNGLQLKHEKECADLAQDLSR